MNTQETRAFTRPIKKITLKIEVTVLGDANLTEDYARNVMLREIKQINDGWYDPDHKHVYHLATQEVKITEVKTLCDSAALREKIQEGK